MFQRRERVRSACLEAPPDIAENVANAVRFDLAIALRGIDESRTHFRFADQALPNKRPEGLCYAASGPAAPAWRTVGKRALNPFQKAARHSFVAPLFDAALDAVRRLCWRRENKRCHFEHERRKRGCQRTDMARRDDLQIIDAAIFEAALMPIVWLARVRMHRRRQHRLTPGSKDLHERFLAALTTGTNNRRGPEIRASYLAAWIAENAVHPRWPIFTGAPMPPKTVLTAAFAFRLSTSTAIKPL